VPAIIDGSGVAAAKPAPDLLLAAARRLGVDPASCWSIGDSTWDIAAAQAAGMSSIAVSSGSAVSDRVLRAAGPDAIVETLSGVVRLLAECRLASDRMSG
jgi:phosphoglycolate phosphatase-like HAD superfamily hydrolase